MNELVGPVLFFGAAGLIAIGAVGILLSGHLFRMVLALVIAEAGANLMLMLAGYRWDAVAPIFQPGAAAAPMVDPIPQAMVLTAIVIGVGVQALALAMVIRIREAYGTLHMSVIRERLEADLAAEAGLEVPGSRERPAGGRPLAPPGTAPEVPR